MKHFIFDKKDCLLIGQSIFIPDLANELQLLRLYQLVKHARLMIQKAVPLLLFVKKFLKLSIRYWVGKMFLFEPVRVLIQHALLESALNLVLHVHLT